MLLHLSMNYYAPDRHSDNARDLLHPSASFKSVVVKLQYTNIMKIACVMCPTTTTCACGYITTCLTFLTRNKGPFQRTNLAESLLELFITETIWQIADKQDLFRDPSILVYFFLSACVFRHVEIISQLSTSCNVSHTGTSMTMIRLLTSNARRFQSCFKMAAQDVDVFSLTDIDEIQQAYAKIHLHEVRKLSLIIALKNSVAEFNIHGGKCGFV